MCTEMFTNVLSEAIRDVKLSTEEIIQSIKKEPTHTYEHAKGPRICSGWRGPL